MPDGSSVSIPVQTTTATIQPDCTQPTNTQLNDFHISSPAQQINESVCKPEQTTVQATTVETITTTAVKTGRRNSRTARKQSQSAEKVETTTLKSIKTALAESPSHLSPQLNVEHMKCDSPSSQSSQSSTSSLYALSTKDSLNDNNSTYLDQPTSSASSSQSSTANGKSRPGRRNKNQPKEDPCEKKIRSLERNREVCA